MKRLAVLMVILGFFLIACNEELIISPEPLTTCRSGYDPVVGYFVIITENGQVTRQESGLDAPFDCPK